MAAVGAFAYTSADFKSPIIFATNLSSLSGVAGIAGVTDQLHGKKVSLVYAGVAAGATLSGLVNSAVLKPRGLSLLNSVAVPPTSADLSSLVVKANEGAPDGIVLFLGPAQTNSFIKAARQLGINGPIFVSAQIETASRAKQQLGDTTQNLFFYNIFRDQGPGYNEFLSQMAAYGQPASNADDNVINGWLSVTMFANEARKLTNVTRSSVLDAFNHLSNYDTGGLTPPLTFATPGTAFGGQAPRIINPTATISVIRNGQFQLYNGGPFIKPFDVPGSGSPTTTTG